MIIHVGDRKPDLVITLSDDGTADDLATKLDSADSIAIVGRQGADDLFNASPDVRDGVTVTHRWDTPETDAPGRIWVRVLVTWADGRVQTFPALGELAVDVQ